MIDGLLDRRPDQWWTHQSELIRERQQLDVRSTTLYPFHKHHLVPAHTQRVDMFHLYGCVSVCVWGGGV